MAHGPWLMLVHGHAHGHKVTLIVTHAHPFYEPRATPEQPGHMCELRRHGRRKKRHVTEDRKHSVVLAEGKVVRYVKSSNMLCRRT